MQKVLFFSRLSCVGYDIHLHVASAHHSSGPAVRLPLGYLLHIRFCVEGS